VIFGFAAMLNRTGMRSDAHGVGRFRQQRKVGESTELDFLDSVPICWGVNSENSSSAPLLLHNDGLYACRFFRWVGWVSAQSGNV